MLQILLFQSYQETQFQISRKIKDTRQQFIFLLKSDIIEKVTFVR